MRIAYLDCFSGMSGDMFLGALVDAGVPAKLLDETVAALDVGARLEISRVERSGISATKVDVYVHGEKDAPREAHSEPPREHAHQHQNDRGNDPPGSHTHANQPVQLREHNYSRAETEDGSSRASRPRPHEHGRSLKQIREAIGNAAISEGGKRSAISIFEALGAAEGKIHNRPVDELHFHEVGGADAMVDIVCGAVGVEALQLDEIVCSPLNVGGGTVVCAHGTFPVPAPAAVELLKGAPVFSSGIQAELVTPTGAAIVKTLATRFGAFPEMKIEQTGYGAGTRDFPGHANVVRLTIGESEARAGKTAQETITVLEANLDDLNPQVFGYVMDRLLEERALDAFVMPVQMKKNRPGMLLTVLCKVEDAARLTQILFSETTTLGVRRREERREVLSRKFVSVTTRWGDVRLKIGSLNGTVANYAPEYEDCRKIAVENHVPLKSVMQEAVQLYLAAGQKH
jgi:pyridinium-3,5-bisthiocarboxylic acid mononucleotide nickel chelatase